MRKFILTAGFCLGILSIMSFSSSNSESSTEAVIAGGPKITCPQGDHYKCVEKGGVEYFKGDGLTTIEL
jgi:hypothetical protein